MTPIPPRAETLDLMPFLHERRKPSRFAPGAEQLFFELECPACHHVEPLPAFGEPSPCNCGLIRQIEATTMHIWRAKEGIHAV